MFWGLGRRFVFSKVKISFSEWGERWKEKFLSPSGVRDKKKIFFVNEERGKR